MEEKEKERCRQFYYALPDAPKIANGGYDPVADVIFMPITLEDTSPLYFAILYHEYFHKRLYQYDVRDFVDVSSEDFTPLEEVIVETATALLLNILSVYSEVKEYETGYIRAWKGELHNKALIPKVFTIVKTIMEPLLDREVTKHDLPIDVRMLLGLF